MNESNRSSRSPLACLSMVESNPNEFFPKIGRIAEKTDALEDREQTKEDDTEDRPVEEIESLCMNCQEQVGDRADTGRAFAEIFGRLSAGCYEITTDDDPVLQRGDHYVVQV